MSNIFIDSEEFRLAYTATGQIITTFARIESALYILFRRYTGMDDALARAVIGEPRYNDVGAAIKRLAASKNMNPAMLDSLSKILGRITTVKNYRNLFAHRAFHLRGDKFDEIVFEEFGFSKNHKANFFISYSMDELAIILAECIKLQLSVQHLDRVINETSDPTHLEALSAWPQIQNMPSYPDQRRTQQPVHPPA